MQLHEMTKEELIDMIHALEEQVHKMAEITINMLQNEVERIKELRDSGL